MNCCFWLLLLLFSDCGFNRFDCDRKRDRRNDCDDSRERRMDCTRERRDCEPRRGCGERESRCGCERNERMERESRECNRGCDCERDDRMNRESRDCDRRERDDRMNRDCDSPRDNRMNCDCECQGQYVPISDTGCNCK